MLYLSFFSILFFLVILALISVGIAIWTIPLYSLLCSGGNNDVALELGILNCVNNEYVHYSINLLEYNINVCFYDNMDNSSFSCNNVMCSNLIFSNEVIFCYDTFWIEDGVTSENVLEVQFLTYTSSSTVVEFISLQDNIYLRSDETGLCFFSIYNPTEYDVSVLSIYFPYPSEVSLFVGKIQCFCFDLLKCSSYESVELPVLFYLEKEVVDILNGKDWDSLILTYTMFTVTI